MRFSSRLMVFLMLLLLTISATFVVSMAGCSGDDDDDDNDDDDGHSTEECLSMIQDMSQCLVELTVEFPCGLNNGNDLLEACQGQSSNDEFNCMSDCGFNEPVCQDMVDCMKGCCGEGDDDDDDNDTGDDDDDDATGCAPVTDPFPPQDQIYQFLDSFTSMADYVTSFQGDIVAMGQAMEGSASMNSFQVQFPQDFEPGEHDMRWDDDPSTNPIMGVYMKGVSMSGTYEKAFYVYRGCMTIEETGVEGDNFRATFTDMYMTEAEIDLNSGQISIVTPGEGFQAFIMDMAIECHIAPYSTTPGMGDLCMNM